jgi:hypothetical protein
MGSEHRTRLSDGQRLVIEFDEAGNPRFQRTHSPAVLNLERRLVWMERGHDLIQVWESDTREFRMLGYTLVDEYDPR